MISHKYQFLFIHIPKCAGTTIERTLADNEDIFNWNFRGGHTMDPNPLPFGGLRKEALSRTINEFQEYYYFTFVRNPFARILSTYAHIKRRVDLAKLNPSPKNNAQYFLRPKPLESFDEFVDPAWLYVMKGKGQGLSKFEKYHLTPQCRFMPEFNNNRFLNYELDFEFSFNFIGRVEAFEQDLNLLLNEFSLDKPLVVENTSTYTQDKLDYFNQSNIEKIVQAYPLDFEKLNYSTVPDSSSFGGEDHISVT